MDAVTGLSASGPAFVYIIIESFIEGGVKVGLPRDVATLLAAQMVHGAANMVLETGEHPAKLKDIVTTPAGCTVDGLLELEDGGLARHAYQGRGSGHPPGTRARERVIRWRAACILSCWPAKPCPSPKSEGWPMSWARCPLSSKNSGATVSVVLPRYRADRSGQVRLPAFSCCRAERRSRWDLNPFPLMCMPRTLPNSTFGCF